MEVDLEALEPCPDIYALFAYYNDLYFENKLGACSVEWSTGRMTLCVAFSVSVFSVMFSRLVSLQTDVQAFVVTLLWEVVK